MAISEAGFITCQMSFLTSNQQCQSTGNTTFTLSNVHIASVTMTQ